MKKENDDWHVPEDANEFKHYNDLDRQRLLIIQRCPNCKVRYITNFDNAFCLNEGCKKTILQFIGVYEE